MAFGSAQNPDSAAVVVQLPADGLETHEVIVYKATNTGTIQSAFAMADATAAATSNLTAVFYNRGTALAGTTVLGTAGGSGSTWGATTPKSVTLSNNTGIAGDEYITCAITRIAASTASAWNISAGLEFVNGSPATAA